MTIFDCTICNPIDPIDRVQNVYDDLGISQTVERDGSEWTRTVSQDLGIEQSYSDFYGESVVSAMTLVSTPDPDRDLVLSLSSTIVFAEVTTVAGGRLGSGGVALYPLVYDSGGPDADEGAFVYVDDGTGEAVLATHAGTDEEAEVAGALNSGVTAGQSAGVLSEGQVERPDWTAVAGTATLTPGAYYYLHTGGQMRITPPASGKIVILGRAMTTTKFDIEINPAWDA